MKKLSLLLFIFLGSVGMVLAQRTVSGTITDVGGEALIGANVLVKGSDAGTITDIDGHYDLNVPDGYTTLIVSYTGYTTKDVELGASNTLDIVLSEGVLLGDIVVTALGVKRNSRDVAYANQKVTSEDLLSTPSKNTLEALRGKTAGVRITTGSGSVGSSSKIVLRAEASLTGDNNALIVIDGVPIENNSTGGGDGSGEGGYSDYGNRFNDINPEDIESVTVLKGPSATALYGSRGASGVLLVTTKKGTKGKTAINFSSTSSVEKAYVLLRRQDQYGQGLINPDGSNNVDSGENFSWGRPFDGVTRPWTSPVDSDGDGKLEYLSRPYSAVPNQLENFFRTGRTFVNSLSLSGGKEGFTYYASYGNTNQKGILENMDYQRHNLTLNAAAKFSDKLVSSFGITFANVDQNTTQEGSRAFEGVNPYSNAIQSPVNIPFNELRDYKSQFHDFSGYYGSYTVNPYFLMNEHVNNGNINNLLGNFSLTYSLMDNLKVSTKLGANIVGTQITEATPVYAYRDHLTWGDNLALVSRGGRQSTAGSYVRREINSRNIDWTTTASHRATLNEAKGIRLNSIVGFNVFDRTVKGTTAQTRGGLVVPGVYNLANSVEAASSSQNDNRYRIMGLFTNLSLGLNDKLFIEYSARNDWSSTLPVANQSFFYQSLGVSAIVSDYLNMENSPMNHLKLRASYGTTGKDAGLYLLNSTFFGNPTLVTHNDIYSIDGPLNGQSVFTKGARIGNPDLKPELTTTFEFGLDAGFFNDKIEVEYTYYSSNHSDQIVNVSLPRSSGYSQTALNVGKITNKGHELGLTYRPFTNKNGFTWDLSFIFSTNKNEVVKISDQTDELVIWNSGRGVTFVAEEGEAFGTWKGQSRKYDPEGNPVVNSNGTLAYTEENVSLGNVQPDWLGSIGSTLGWKNLRFNFLLDTRQGGSIFSLTKSAVEFNGTSVTSTINDRKPFVLENSVTEVLDGDGNVVGYEPNTTSTLADAFIFDGNYSRNVLDGSFIKLREIGLTYDIPTSLSKKMNIGRASIGLFVKNVKFWLPEDNSYGDPETNGPGTSQQNITGVETSQTPPSRSFGVNLNIKF